MTGCSRGDVVLVSFVFPDETGAKQRPAVVVSSDAYNRGRQEAVISAISSRTDRLLTRDHLINDWQRAGLLFPSVATGIIRTVKQGMVTRKLGTMPGDDMRSIDKQMRLVLGLNGR